MEHLNRPQAALKEILRVLKPSGLALITVPNGTAFIGWRLWERLFPYRWFYHRFLPSEHPKRTWQPIDTLYDYDELIKLIRDSSFRILDMKSHQFIPPFLYSAPLVGRIYKKIKLDRLVGKLLPVKLGYRLIFIAKKPD